MPQMSLVSRLSLLRSRDIVKHRELHNDQSLDRKVEEGTKFSIVSPEHICFFFCTTFSGRDPVF